VRQEADDIAGKTLGELRQKLDERVKTREIEQTISSIKLCGMSIFYSFLYASMAGMQISFPHRIAAWRPWRRGAMADSRPTLTGVSPESMEE
jgi:hypothetical protein